MFLHLLKQCVAFYKLLILCISNVMRSIFHICAATVGKREFFSSRCFEKSRSELNKTHTNDRRASRARERVGYRYIHYMTRSFRFVDNAEFCRCSATKKTLGRLTWPARQIFSLGIVSGRVGGELCGLSALKYDRPDNFHRHSGRCRTGFVEKFLNCCLY